MQQNKNIVIFLVMSFLMVVGWAYLQVLVRGPQPAKPTNPQAVLTAKEWPFTGRPGPEQATIIKVL